ncbi:MAG TPA: hypothetical protein VMY42_23835 [Thermoguttaceae bacterium]|nr:hypothetical protein [Thermoguttaceae bacterium]
MSVHLDDFDWRQIGNDAAERIAGHCNACNANEFGANTVTRYLAEAATDRAELATAVIAVMRRGGVADLSRLLELPADEVPTAVALVIAGAVAIGDPVLPSIDDDDIG